VLADPASRELPGNAQQEQTKSLARFDRPPIPVLRVDLREEIEDRIELLRYLIESEWGWRCGVVCQQGAGQLTRGDISCDDGQSIHSRRPRPEFDECLELAWGESNSDCGRV
jgi:hypothetical protein